MERLNKAQLLALKKGDKFLYHDMGEVWECIMIGQDDEGRWLYWDMPSMGIEEAEQLIEDINEDGSWIPTYSPDDETPVYASRFNPN